MNKETRFNPERLPDKELLDQWRRHPATIQIWQAFSKQYDLVQSLRICPEEKIGYYRGQYDMLEEFAKLFGREL